MQLNPSLGFDAYETACGKVAAVGTHLMRKSGNALTCNFPIDVASVAPFPDVTLILLKERNALLPVHSSTAAMPTPDISAYNSLLTTNDSYSANVTDDFAVKLAGVPSLVYLDVWNGTLYSSDQALLYPSVPNLNRSADQTSALAKQLAANVEQFGRNIAYSKQSTVSSNDLSALILADPLIITTTLAYVLGQIVPSDCTLEPFMGGPQSETPIPGAVAIMVDYFDPLGIATDAVGTYYYWIVPPIGSVNGYSLECMHMTVTTGASATSTQFFSYDCEFSSTANSFSLNVQVQSPTGGGSLWSTRVTTSDYFTNSFPSLTITYGGVADWTLPGMVGTDPRIAILSARAPIPVAMQTQIGYYLAELKGSVATSDAIALNWWAAVASTALSGKSSALMSLAIPAVNGLVAAKPVPNGATYVYIGSTFSVDKPNGTALPVSGLYKDVFTTDKDSRSVWVFATDRLRDQGINPYAPFVETILPKAEIASYMAYLQTKPNFPASLTQAMIDQLSLQDIGIMMLNPIPVAKAAYGFTRLAMKTLDGHPIDEASAYVGLDSLGAPVLYDDAIKELVDNGFFKDQTATMCYLPFMSFPGPAAQISVVLDVGLDPAWDTGIVPLQTMTTLAQFTASQVSFAPTAAWTAAWNADHSGLQSPLLSYWNELRVFLGLDPLTTMPPVTEDTCLDSLNPATFRSIGSLQGIDGITVYPRLSIPYSSTPIEAMLIGRQLPNTMTLLFNMASKVLAAYIDPL